MLNTQLKIPKLCFAVLSCYLLGILSLVTNTDSSVITQFLHQAKPFFLNALKFQSCLFLCFVCGSVSELKMTSFDRDLEEKLKESGSTLLNPPSSIDDLLTLLDVMTLLLFIYLFIFVKCICWKCWSDCEFIWVSQHCGISLLVLG